MDASGGGGITLSNREISKEINNGFLLVYASAIFIYLHLRILIHLECAVYTV